jgi:Ser/Thr protein kinase RdoA (MazF antagonist)
MTTPRKNQIIQRILAAYQRKATEILAPQKGYRNRSYPVRLADGALANLILYKSELGILAKIRAANTVSNYLAIHGYPTRQTLDSRIITLHTPAKITYGALYNYLPGHTIPWEAYTQKHIKLLGLTMSRMHATLEHLKSAPLPQVADEYQLINQRMEAYFRNPQVQLALQDKLGLQITLDRFPVFKQLLNHTKTLPNQQPLHMDFVRSNILFAPAETTDTLVLDTIAIAGILDFEKASLGHPLFDIARTLAFLLVDCKFKTPNQIRKYFLHSGYHKRGEARISEPRLLEPLLDLFLTYDFYKFLRHNPYEYLAQNEHFIRTHKLMLKRRLVSRVKIPLAR